MHRSAGAVLGNTKIGKCLLSSAARRSVLVTVIGMSRLPLTRLSHLAKHYRTVGGFPGEGTSVRAFLLLHLGHGVKSNLGFAGMSYSNAQAGLVHFMRTVVVFIGHPTMAPHRGARSCRAHRTKGQIVAAFGIITVLLTTEGLQL
jgi:hypothetical protein